MAECSYCGLEMADPNTKSCSWEGHTDSIPYRLDHDPGRRCSDCFVAYGGFHHPGCCVERCPRCKGQRISCGCDAPKCSHCGREEWDCPKCSHKECAGCDIEMYADMEGDPCPCGGKFEVCDGCGTLQCSECEAESKKENF